MNYYTGPDLSEPFVLTPRIYHNTIVENQEPSKSKTPRRASTSLNGNGCKHHPSCWDCPLPDCRWPK